MKTMTLDFIPKAKERPRLGRHGVYTPQATLDSEEDIARCWVAAHGKYTGPVIAVRSEIQGVYPMPASWSAAKRARMLGKPKLTRPDKDNLEKTVLDALSGVAYVDDAHVWDGRVRKIWGEKAYTEITLYYGEGSE